MPKKGTKKVKAHLRQRNIAKFGGIEVKDPFIKPKLIQPYYRKKTKRKKR